MDAVINNVPKQPKPSFDNEKAKDSTKGTSDVKKEKRKINRPNVGVIDAPQISHTPLSDSIALKKKENPKISIAPAKKSRKNFKFQNALAFLMTGCGIVSLVSLIKSIKKR